MQRASRKQKEVEPKKSIFENQILKSIIFSLIASVSVIVISFEIAEFSQSTSIRDHRWRCA